MSSFMDKLAGIGLFIADGAVVAAKATAKGAKAVAASKAGQATASGCKKAGTATVNGFKNFGASLDARVEKHKEAVTRKMAEEILHMESTVKDLEEVQEKLK